MKILKRLLVAAIVIGVIATAFLLISDTVFDLDFGIIRDTKVSSSAAILTQTRDVFSLNTVEVVYKVVFPYDFIPGDMNWSLFLKQHREGRRLSLLEGSYLQVYDLCQEIGIELATRKREFVVLTTIIKAGFDLSAPLFTSPDTAGETATDYISINESGEVIISMPAALVIDFIIEDADTETYPYPDIGIDPEGFRKLTSFVRERIMARAESEGIYGLARENGKRFLRQILLDSGYSSVSFRE